MGLANGHANERAQMFPGQGEMVENNPLTRKCTSEPSGTLKRVTTRINTILILIIIIRSDWKKTCATVIEFLQYNT